MCQSKSLCSLSNGTLQTLDSVIAGSLSEKRIDEIVDQRVDQRLKTRRSLVYCVADLGADVIALAIDSEKTGVQRLKRESHQVIQTAVWI